MSRPPGWPGYIEFMPCGSPSGGGSTSGFLDGRSWPEKPRQYWRFTVGNRAIRLLTRPVSYATSVRPDARVTCVFCERFPREGTHPATRTGIGGRPILASVGTGITKTTLGWLAVWLSVQLVHVPIALAEHEADHRFTVQGAVCGAGGEPVAGVEVVAKDARISVARTTFTDDRGRYKVTLHLHNENRGDPIIVYVKDKEGTVQQERQASADFDPNDVHAERHTTVNFGSGCESLSDEPPAWVYYGAGVAALAGGVWLGARLFRGNKQRTGSHKGRKR